MNNDQKPDNKDSEFNFNNLDNFNNNVQENKNEIIQEGQIQENEDLLKYETMTYTDKDRVNFIKKIEMYLNDPDLRKIALRKIHIKEYLTKTKLVKLDAKTLNYVYDELKNFDVTEGLSDAAFKGYLTVNNLIESALCKLNIDVEGYSDALDVTMNRILMKQITIDNFDYITGTLTPEYALILNTTMTITGTYKKNIIQKKKKKIDQIENNNIEQKNNQIEENDNKIEQKKNNIQLTNTNLSEQQKKIKNFINEP